MTIRIKYTHDNKTTNLSPEFEKRRKVSWSIIGIVPRLVLELGESPTAP